MPALPFWNMIACDTNRRNFIKIDENTPIGLHIKKRRIELKLRQEDAARIIEVCSDALRYWETERSIPRMENIPKVIKFLGYNPYQFETEILGGRIKYYRLLNGLSHKKFGKILGVDASTVGSWESNKFIPKPPILIQLKEILFK